MGMRDHFAPLGALVFRFADSQGVALGFHILCLWHVCARRPKLGDCGLLIFVLLMSRKALASVVFIMMSVI